MCVNLKLESDLSEILRVAVTPTAMVVVVVALFYSNVYRESHEVCLVCNEFALLKWCRGQRQIDAI